MRAGDRIPDALLERPVAGLNLAPETLRDQLGEVLTPLLFLRHFGCMFYRETLADIRASSDRDSRFPRAHFFFQASPAEGRAFLRRYWQDAADHPDYELVCELAAATAWGEGRRR